MRAAGCRGEGTGGKPSLHVTTQLTPDLPDNDVKHARVREYTARVFLVLEQSRGNLSSYRGFCIRVLSSYVCTAYEWFRSGVCRAYDNLLRGRGRVK